jgi:tRNA A-37 threonylcarbamoyl transferase component Bud32
MSQPKNRMERCIDSEKYVIIMNNVEGTLLRDVKENQELSACHCAKAVVSLADTLNLLHAYYIFHYDLHDKNVIVRDSCN